MVIETDRLTIRTASENKMQSINKSGFAGGFNNE